MERIEKRGRVEEQVIQLSYLKELGKFYEDLIRARDASPNVKVLEIDGTLSENGMEIVAAGISHNIMKFYKEAQSKTPDVTHSV